MGQAQVSEVIADTNQNDEATNQQTESMQQDAPSEINAAQEQNSAPNDTTAKAPDALVPQDNREGQSDEPQPMDTHDYGLEETKQKQQKKKKSECSPQNFDKKTYFRLAAESEDDDEDSDDSSEGTSGEGGCDYDVDEEDFDISDLAGYTDDMSDTYNTPKDSCGCGNGNGNGNGNGCRKAKDCPSQINKKKCDPIDCDPFYCDSLGFKNFLAEFRCKYPDYSKCASLAKARCAYRNLDDCTKRKYRAMGCTPPRCKQDCVAFTPITNAKRRPKCKPCGF